MTDEQIDAMHAGPEMNFKVASAIRPADAALYKPTAGEPHCEFEHRYFRPSTDWNDTMSAAERFGLFEQHIYLGRTYKRTEWTITRETDCEGDTYHEPIAAAPAGPLAICRAILKLSQSVLHPS